MIQSLTIASLKEACLWGLVFFQGLGVFRFAQEENPASAGKMVLFYGKKGLSKSFMVAQPLSVVQNNAFACEMRMKN